MRWVYILVIILLLGAMAVAQEGFPPINQLVHSTHVQRSARYSTYYEGPVCSEDSTTLFVTVAELRQAAKTTNDRELDFEADLLRAHYFFCSRTIHPDIILTELNRTLEKAVKTNSIWLQVRLESMLGFLNCNRLQQYEQGLIHLTHAANLMNDLPSSEYPLKQVCNYHVGFQLFRFGDYTNALVYLKKAAKVKVPEGIKDHSFQIYNTLGLIYRKMNRLADSDSCFQMANQFSKALGNSSWVAITAGNLGENHFLRSQLDEAYPLLQTDAMMAQQLGDWGLASNSLSLMGDIRLQQGNLQAADSLLAVARACAYKSGNYKRLQVLYPRLAKLYAVKGDANLAQMFIDSSLYVNDSLERAGNSFRSARATQKVELERVQQKAEQKENERAKQVLLRNSIILILVLLVVIIALLFNRHRLKIKERQLELESARIQAEQRLDEAIDRLNLLVKEKKEIAEKLAKSGTQQLENAVILTDKDWRDFSETFESVHPGFFQRLDEKLPGLTTAEIRFMVLKRLNFSVKEMAAVLGVSAEAIRQMRYRIKKKLSLGKEDDLGELVQSV